MAVSPAADNTVKTAVVIQRFTMPLNSAPMVSAPYDGCFHRVRSRLTPKYSGPLDLSPCTV